MSGKAEKARVTCPDCEGEFEVRDLPDVQALIRAGAALTRRAVLDPGAFVKRGPDYDGSAYGERLDRWQDRAVETALQHLTTPGCANYAAPVTCLTAPSSVTGRCHYCKERASCWLCRHRISVGARCPECDCRAHYAPEEA